MTARQIEACRRTISRRIKRGGKSLSAYSQTNQLPKPLEVRMGKGKGSGILGLVKFKPGKRSRTKLKVLAKNWRVKHLRLAAKLLFKTTIVTPDGNVMKTKDLREKSVEELTVLLDEQQLNQFRLRMAKATGQLGQIARSCKLLQTTIASY